MHENDIREPAQPRATGREIEALILNRIARKHQTEVAAECGLSTSAVSRIVSGETGITTDRIGPFLFALGLRVVDAGDVVVPRAELDALRLFAAKGLNHG